MTQELAKFQEIIAPAPQVLAKSENRVEKAKEVGQKILSRIEVEGMSDELDQEANAYLVKVRKTGELINKERKPITQLLDHIKKSFTSLEAELSPKTAGGIYSQVQQHRDQYAQKKLEEQRRREEQAQRKKAIEDEKVKVRTEIESRFANYFIDYLSTKEEELQMLFNIITLEEFEDFKKSIKGFPEEYPHSHVKEFDYIVTTIYLEEEEIKKIANEVVLGKLTQYRADFQKSISELKREIWDQLPAKKIELEAIAKAEKEDKEEAERLRKEQQERERKEKERLAKETQERKEREQQEAKAREEADSMNNLFNAEAEAQGDGSSAQVRSGYEIAVTHPSGYAQIFQYWFQNEGKDLPIDVIEKRTMKQMKSFCEKAAHKTDEKIQSPYLKYKETVKTRATA